jgi:YesN/AraC family two-component response regulator
MMQETEVLDQLSRSKVYHDFARAFREVTQVPLHLAAPNKRISACYWNGHRYAHQFLDKTEIPVRLGDKIIGVLQMGQQTLETTATERFIDLERQSRDAGMSRGFGRIEDGDCQIFVPSQSRYEAMVRLLEIFAQQLSSFANEILIEQDEREPYRVRLARAYISNHQSEYFSLSDLARSVHVSTFYLCKIFKKATGLTFIEFRNRLRIKMAKTLLVNPNLSVSEIAYRVGFQSLTQFNRLFRRTVGESPTAFRCSLKGR